MGIVCEREGEQREKGEKGEEKTCHSHRVVISR